MTPERLAEIHKKLRDATPDAGLYLARYAFTVLTVTELRELLDMCDSRRQQRGLLKQEFRNA